MKFHLYSSDYDFSDPAKGKKAIEEKLALWKEIKLIKPNAYQWRLIADQAVLELDIEERDDDEEELGVFLNESGVSLMTKYRYTRWNEPESISLLAKSKSSSFTFYLPSISILSLKTLLAELGIPNTSKLYVYSKKGNIILNIGAGISLQQGTLFVKQSSQHTYNLCLLSHENSTPTILASNNVQADKPHTTISSHGLALIEHYKRSLLAQKVNTLLQEQKALFKSSINVSKTATPKYLSAEQQKAIDNLLSRRDLSSQQIVLLKLGSLGEKLTNVTKELYSESSHLFKNNSDCIDYLLQQLEYIVQTNGSSNQLSACFYPSLPHRTDNKHCNMMR